MVENDRKTKKYVLLIGSIVQMGGGQVYARNIVQFMEKQGWCSIVISGIEGEVLVPELRCFQNNVCKHLVCAPMVFARNTLKKVLERLIGIIGSAEEIIIESCSSYLALWGELIAEQIHAKHIVHILDEHPESRIPTDYLSFYDFKFERRELFGICKDTIPLIFRGTREITPEDNLVLKAWCSDVVTDDPNIELCNRIPEQGTNIGIFGRLDKPFVMNAVCSCLTIAEKHPDTRFNIIFIGDSDSKVVIERIKKVFSNRNNVNLVFLGYVFPVPKALFPKIDVFISTSGSARVAWEEDRPTIAVDCCDGYAIGVLGYTTTATAYRSNEPQIDICELAEEILFEGLLEKLPYQNSTQDAKNAVFSANMELIASSSKDESYYPVITIKPRGIDRITRFLRRVLGTELLLRMRPFLAKVLRYTENVREN